MAVVAIGDVVNVYTDHGKLQAVVLRKGKHGRYKGKLGVRFIGTTTVHWVTPGMITLLGKEVKKLH